MVMRLEIYDGFAVAAMKALEHQSGDFEVDPLTNGQDRCDMVKLSCSKQLGVCSANRR